MNRRNFLFRVGGAVLAVPAVLHLSACGGDDDGGGGDTPDAASGATEFTISSDGGHIHELTVKCSDVNGSSDVTYTSTNASSHTHQVTLTAAELGMIASGSTVTKTTNDGHTHNWTISKPSNAC